MNTTKIIIALPMSIIKCIEYYEKNGLIDKDKLFNSIIENQLDEILNTEIIEHKYSYNADSIPFAVNLNRGTAEILGLFAARLGTTIADRLSCYLEYSLINTIFEIETLYFNSGGSNSAHKPPTSFNKESRRCEQKEVQIVSADIESYIKNSNNANNILKSREYMQYVFLEDDFENSFKFEDIADEDLEDTEINNHPITNNIFLNVHNLNHDNNKIIDKEERCIINLINPPNAYREVSIVFGYNNIKQILKGKIEYQTLINKLRYRGKHKVTLDVNELKRIVYKYIDTVKDLNQRPFSYFDEDVVSSFINYYKDGSINSIVSYYIKKAQAKNKNNSKLDNIIFTFNVDSFRSIHFAITPDNFNFNPHEDREFFILDYIRMYWELYMLLVFTHICNISQEDEEAYFIKFYKVITLAVFTGMKMFLQLELSRSYGEFYEELKGFKTKDNKYLSDSGTKERQQITFKIKNSDFLTEAYKQEYQGAIYIDKRIGEVKNDTHIDILLTIMRGNNDNKALFELTISGQYPFGRIYSSDTNPEVNINLNNMYAYGLLVMQPIIYLFRTCLNYSKDLEIKSYYTELQTYLEKYKGIKTHGLVPKLLSVILLAIHKRPNEEELTTILNKYFKTTDKAQKAEFRKLYKDIETSLAKKKDRLIDKMREELWRIVW